MTPLVRLYSTLVCQYTTRTGSDGYYFAATTGSPTKAPVAPAPGAGGTISGKVTDPDDKPLSGATMTLKNSTGEVVATRMTGPDGKYEFTNVPPGEYTVEEKNPPGYPENVSDKDNSPDGDAEDSDENVDDVIFVTLNGGRS